MTPSVLDAGAKLWIFSTLQKEKTVDQNLGTHQIVSLSVPCAHIGKDSTRVNMLLRDLGGCTAFLHKEIDEENETTMIRGAVRFDGRMYDCAVVDQEEGLALKVTPLDDGSYL